MKSSNATITCAHLTQIGNTKHKANGVQDVGLTTAVQTRNSIEGWIKSRNNRTRGVGFESVHNNLLNVHG